MWTIEPLASRHDRSRFVCGEAALDDWLKTRATQWTRKGLSRVFVATHGASDVVRGYYSLSSHRVEYAALPERQTRSLPRWIGVPAVLLGRLAVERDSSGRGLGRYLLFDALRRTVAVADRVGAAVLEVDALNGRARDFYLAHGFRSLRDDERHLFLSLAEIRGLDL